MRISKQPKDKTAQPQQQWQPVYAMRRDRPPSSRWRRFGIWLSGVLVLAGVIIVVLRLGDLERLVELLGQVRAIWLLAAALLQAGTYVCAAAVWYLPLRRGGICVPLVDLLPLGLAKLFTDQALPSGGVSGALLVIQALTRRGIARELAMAALLVDVFSYYAAYLLAALSSLAILAFYHQINAAVLGATAVFTLVAVGIPVTLFWLRKQFDNPWFRRVQRLPGIAELLRTVAAAPSELLHDSALVLQATAVQALIFVLDAVTLWLMLLALGQPVTALAVFPSFIMASIAATLGPIPLGLGTFEAVAVAMLGLLGVPLEAALAATLLWRGFTFWLPMVPGLWLARREARRS